MRLLSTFLYRYGLLVNLRKALPLTALRYVEVILGFLLGLLFVAFCYYCFIRRSSSYDLSVPVYFPMDAMNTGGVIMETTNNDKQDIELTVELDRGASLGHVLYSLNVVDQQVAEISRGMHKMTDLKRLSPGQRVSLALKCITRHSKNDNLENDTLPAFQVSNVSCFVKTLRLHTNNDKILTAKTIEDRLVFDSETINKSVIIRKIEGVINSSLYHDAVESGIPPNVIYQVLREYSFSLDFQRDIRVGDKFVFVFEEIYDDSGNKLRNGNVLFSSMNLRNGHQSFYAFDGSFYKPDGVSVSNAMLRTPIDGARIGSRFGMRRHPILGYTRFHRGVDFAAMTGTPIYAASDGMIEVIGFNKSAGNMITIKHDGGYKTRYFHMKAFYARLKLGSKVKQRQIIGYVGTTGMSTGPHLHFEVLYNGKQVDPTKQKFASYKKLHGDKLEKFKLFMRKIDSIDVLIKQQSHALGGA